MNRSIKRFVFFKNYLFRYMSIFYLGYSYIWICATTALSVSLSVCPDRLIDR